EEREGQVLGRGDDAARERSGPQERKVSERDLSGVAHEQVQRERRRGERHADAGVEEVIASKTVVTEHGRRDHEDGPCEQSAAVHASRTFARPNTPCGRTSSTTSTRTKIASVRTPGNDELMSRCAEISSRRPTTSPPTNAPV